MARGNDTASIAVLMEKTANIERDVSEIKQAQQALYDRIEGNFVQKHEFEPVRNGVYGLIAAFGLAIVAGVVKLLGLGK
jgi:hypothetical protein